MIEGCYQPTDKLGRPIGSRRPPGERVRTRRLFSGILEIRASRLVRPLRFGAVGASAVALEMGVFMTLLSWLSVPAARFCAIPLAMTWSFLWNRQLTFSDARKHSLLRQYGLFWASCSLGAVVSWGICVALTFLIPLFAQYPGAAALLGIAPGTCLNYVLCRRLAFEPA
jgi:putative flippase GtrA